MNRTRYTLAATLLAVCLPAVADTSIDGLDGFIAAAIGQGDVATHYGSNTRHNEGVASELRGTVSYTDSSGFGGQLDYVRFSQRFGQSNMDVHIDDAAGHLYYRNGTGLLGIIGQHSRAGSDADLLATRDFWGVEAQAYLARASLYVQAGQGTWDSFGSMQRGYFASVRGRYFVDDNLQLEASVNKQDDDAIRRWKQESYAFGVEKRLQNSPWSVLARYEYVYEAWGDNDKQNRLLLGVKYNFGKPSLLQRDREGSSLQPVERVLYWGGIA